MDRLARILAEVRRNRERREKAYRERALRLCPWVCRRCAREFNDVTLQLLTVHHKDHNLDNNPPDGSNWELLCVYCHVDGHARQLNNPGRTGEVPVDGPDSHATHKAFADLKDFLRRKA